MPDMAAAAAAAAESAAPELQRRPPPPHFNSCPLLHSCHLPSSSPSPSRSLPPPPSSFFSPSPSSSTLSPSSPMPPASPYCCCLSCQNRFCCSLDYCSPARLTVPPLQSYLHPLPDGEPLYKSLLRPRHSPQASFADYILSPYNHRPVAPVIPAHPPPASPLSREFEDAGSHGFSSPVLDKVTLYRWYLTRPAGCQTSGIAVGGFLSSRATNSERVETAAIIRRMEERKLLTQSGVVVNLVGTIDDCATLANGFSIQMVHLFLSGFPHVWSLLVGTMPGSLNVEKDSNICGKVSCQPIVFESKEKLPTACHSVGNRDQVIADDDSHFNGGKNMSFMSATREPPEIMETFVEPCEKRVLDSAIYGEMECCIRKEGTVDAADISTGTGIHVGTPNDAKLDQAEILATTSGLNMGTAVDSCGKLNTTDIPYIESPSIDECEMESNGERILSQSHSKRRKIGFINENEPSAADVSHREKNFENFQSVHPDVSAKNDPEFEAIPSAVDKGINTHDQKKTIMHKKKSTKNGKQRKRTRFVRMRPRRSIKHKVSKGKIDCEKDRIDLYEEKGIMQHNEKIQDEDWSGKDQHVPSTPNEHMDSDQRSILDCEIQQKDKAEYGSAESYVSSEEKEEDKQNDENSEIECKLKARIESCISRNSGSTINSPEDTCSIRDPPIHVLTRKTMKHKLPPPLPLPTVSVSKQLVSKAFGLKTSRSGRILVPPLAHWRNQSIIRDSDGGIIAIQDGSKDTMRVDTGVFNFKPPAEARARKLQKWLSVTAAECFTERSKSRKQRCTLK